VRVPSCYSFHEREKRKVRRIVCKLHLSHHPYILRGFVPLCEYLGRNQRFTRSVPLPPDGTDRGQAV
jgi:hypothetical protein